MSPKSARPFYHEFAWAYDLLQTEKVAPRVDFMQQVLAEGGVGMGARVLDAGCGTGRYTAEFARRGFRAYGVDRSGELVAVARKRGSAAEFVRADLLAISFANRFDMVLCRGVLNDFVTDGGRRRIFGQFATWLRPGGILMFDVREWTRSVARYRENPMYRRTVELPDGELRFQSETRLDSESRLLVVQERFEEKTKCAENEFVMRPWTAEEIALGLAGNGFEEVACGAGYGENDWGWKDRLVVTARKVR